MNITGDNIWGKPFRKTTNIVSRKIAGETILVPITGRLADMQRIFSLNPVAEFIWEQMDGNKKLAEIHDDILNHFHVEKEQAELDIKEFISDLIKEGLITTD
jgi:methyltransferase-like protein